MIKVFSATPSRSTATSTTRWSDDLHSLLYRSLPLGDPLSGRQRVRVIWAKFPLQMGQHIPELFLRPGMIPARRHLPGNAEPGGQAPPA
jgi:hypothetical protein